MRTTTHELLVVMVMVVMLTVVGMGKAAWFEEDVFKDSKRVVGVGSDDDEGEGRVSSDEQRGLLTVLLGLDKLYQDSQDSPRNPPQSYGQPPRSPSSSSSSSSASSPGASRGDFLSSVDGAALLKDVLDQVKVSQPVKRARYDVSGVLPPLGELCRVMHMRGCSHSRHK